MNKKSAMSAIGFAIVIVILLGIVMIISAPTILDNSSSKEEEKKITQQTDLLMQFQEFENQVNQRLSNLENNASNVNNQSGVSNKYVCTIEGNVDANGIVVPVDSRNGLTKFVFVCEYKQ